MEPIRIADIPGYPNYRVSDDGSIQSNRLPSPLTGKRDGVWRNLRSFDSRHRKYQYVSLFSESKKPRKFFVHILVLNAFVGPKPEGMECLHGDGDQTNNRLENLRWGTRKENVQDSVRLGSVPSGERHFRATLTDQEVAEIRLLSAQGWTNVRLANTYKTSGSTISRIVNMKTRAVALNHSTGPAESVTVDTGIGKP